MEEEMKLILDDQYQWLAMDKCGSWWLYIDRPSLGLSKWNGYGDGGSNYIASSRCFLIPQCDNWKKSLHKRTGKNKWKPVVDVPDLKVDDKVIVWNKTGFSRHNRHFSHFDGSGKINCFIGGNTSFTSEEGTASWVHYETV
jgi:hypothetical protein